MQYLKTKIGLMASSLPMMCYLAPTAALATISDSFPGSSPQLVQMLISVTNLVNVLASILVSRFTPYVFKKHFILFSGLSFPIAGLLIYFFHPSLLLMIFFTSLMGIGSGIRVTCVASLIYESFEGKERSRLMGIQRAFISGGSMFFVWLGGLLASFHWEYCYLVFLLTLPLSFIEAFCLPKGKLDVKKNASHQNIHIPSRVWFLSSLAFVFGVLILTFNSNISMLIQQRSLGGTLEASYASMFYNFAGIFAGCLAGVLISHIHEHTFSCGILLASLGLLICFLSGQLPALCIGAILCGSAFSIFVPAGNFFAAHYASDVNRSFSIAVFNAGNSIGLFLSPILINAFLNPLSISQRFLAAAICMALLLVIFYLPCTLLAARKKL